MTTSVTQLETILNHVLNERANELAKETGFVKRERKLTGADFVQVMVCGRLQNPQASLDQLTQAAQVRSVQISSSGLHQRCTQSAATFLQAVLSELVEQVVTVKAVPVALFKRFRQVLLEDASTIVLPEALAWLWQGCRGGSADSTEHTASALKLHVRLALKKGQLIGPYMSAGRVHEFHGPLREKPLSPGSLYVADRGYGSLARLRERDQQRVRFCQHPKANTVFDDRQGKRIELESALPRTIGQVKVLHISLGKQAPLPVRLILVRVPTEVSEQRRERLKKEAVDKGQAVSAQQWYRAEWTLIVTTTSAKQLGVQQALVLLRERWLIETSFRYGKCELALECPRLWSLEARLKLLGMVMLIYAFMLSLLDPAHAELTQALLRFKCHRTGKRCQNTPAPLYRLRWALSRLWDDYRPRLTCFIPPSDDPCSIASFITHLERIQKNWG